MNAPRVSVCVPTFNYARFLPDCIESVLQQTMADWELVITDDCSTDGTDTIVERYAKADPRVRYIRNEQRLGMSANLKRACDLGRGEYLKVLCSDDWLAPRCLEVLSALWISIPKQSWPPLARSIAKLRVNLSGFISYTGCRFQ